MRPACDPPSPWYPYRWPNCRIADRRFESQVDFWPWNDTRAPLHASVGRIVEWYICRGLRSCISQFPQAELNIYLLISSVELLMDPHAARWECWYRGQFYSATPPHGEPCHWNYRLVIRFPRAGSRQTNGVKPLTWSWPFFVTLNGTFFQTPTAFVPTMSK